MRTYTKRHTHTHAHADADADADTDTSMINKTVAILLTIQAPYMFSFL